MDHPELENAADGNIYEGAECFWLGSNPPKRVIASRVHWGDGDQWWVIPEGSDYEELADEKDLSLVEVESGKLLREFANNICKSDEDPESTSLKSLIEDLIDQIDQDSQI